MICAPRRKNKIRKNVQISKTQTAALVSVPTHHFVQHSADRPEIGLGVVLLVLHDFWCHVQRRAAQGLCEVCTRKVPSEPEVGNLDRRVVSLMRQQQVLRLDISVDEIFRSEEPQTFNCGSFRSHADGEHDASTVVLSSGFLLFYLIAARKPAPRSRAGALSCGCTCASLHQRSILTLGRCCFRFSVWRAHGQKREEGESFRGMGADEQNARPAAYQDLEQPHNVRVPKVSHNGDLRAKVFLSRRHVEHGVAAQNTHEVLFWYLQLWRELVPGDDLDRILGALSLLRRLVHLRRAPIRHSSQPQPASFFPSAHTSSAFQGTQRSEKRAAGEGPASAHSAHPCNRSSPPRSCLCPAAPPACTRPPSCSSPARVAAREKRGRARARGSGDLGGCGLRRGRVCSALGACPGLSAQRFCAILCRCACKLPT